MNKLVETLKQLALSIKKTIENSISKGTIRPEEESYFRWKMDKFQYTDKGITESSAHGDYITKQSWFRATIKLTESIKQNGKYAPALEQLSDAFGKSDKLTQSLEYFIGKLIHRCLYDSKFGETDIDHLIATFLKDLRGEPLKYGAEVELQGITLHQDKFEPIFGISLRQPKIEDLEKEFPVFSPMRQPHLPRPSAILNIEFLGRQANEIQEKVKQAITILRLFKVGSVRYSSYRMYSESITDAMASGTLISGRTDGALETYLITNEDEQKLKKFWQTMCKVIPRSFFGLGITKTDYMTIAYKRYSDALMQDGILERRIANSIMGLEALFLKSGEIQELIYRLNVRVSKLFSLLGYDPHEVKKIVGDAYRVRNLFVHGSQLSYKEKRKLEAKYKNVKNILLSVLDYLRITIIIMILCNREKDEFIDLIDDSLIDRKREEQLSQGVSAAKKVLGNQNV